MWIVEYLLFFIGIKVIVKLFLALQRISISLLSNKNLNEYGANSWALITACTDGIGQGFAETLAKRGFNIIQVGRSPEKLQKTSSDLISKYGIQVKNIVKDFSVSHINPIEFFTDIYNQSKGLDISMVVNNVGFSSGRMLYASTPLEKVLNQLSLNIFPIAFLSRLYIQDLSKRPKRGALINLSSIASQIIRQTVVQYQACKAFDDVLTDVISNEISTKYNGKIDILCLKPGFVDTPLTKDLKTKPLMIDKYQCAEHALKCLGNMNSTAGHWKHVIALEGSHLLAYFRLGY